MAYRPQGVAGGRKLAIQRDSDAILVDGDGRNLTGGIRDLNNVHEITDLLAPNDPGKLYSAIERKAAGWAVMDADTRLSDSSAGAGKGAKGDHRGAYSATIPCKHYAKGTCARGDKCRFSHKGSDKCRGKGGKGKKANNDARRVERSRFRHIGQSHVQRLSRRKLR